MTPISISEAKRLLPLPQLLTKLGHGEHAKKSARCPFHDDKSASFSVFQNGKGAWSWKCHAGCGQGDGVDYLEKCFKLSTRDAIARYCQEAGLRNGESKPGAKTREVFNWPTCVAAFTDEAKRQLAEWRGLSLEFVDWLHGQEIVGLHSGNLALAVHDESGKVISCHGLIDRDKKKWIYEPNGKGTHPLTFGDTRHAGFVLCFESQWDAFGIMDRLLWHAGDGLPDAAVLVTRGSQNGKLIAGKCSPDAVVYAFAQNDAPDLKTGIIPSEDWLKAVVAHAGCKVLRVTTPTPHKDGNDWTKAGATKEEIQTAIRNAKLADVPEAASEGMLQAVEIETQTPDAADIRGQIVAILTNSNLTSREQRKTIGGAVVESLAKRGQLYFHAELRDFRNALFFDRARARLERIQSDGFRAWLAEWTGINRADTLFNAVAAEVETAALSEIHAKSILPETFWTRREVRIYISSGDATLCRISPGKVEMLPNGADGVLFSAGRTLHPWRLTEPRDFFQTCRLFADIQGAAPNAREIVRLWTISLPTNPRSKPPLVAHGEIGSGKTALMRGVCELYGLPPNVAKVEEKLEADFWPTVNAGGLLILDNADTRTKWLADAVAAAATGGCVSRRRLYTDSDTVPLRARAWLAITTSNPTFANDSGLADRLLVVRLKRREGTTSDEELSNEIAANRDTALSFVTHTLAAALADTAQTPDSLNSRHPDFAVFAVRIGRALGRESQAVGALQTAEADKSLFCLQNDTLGAALLAHVTEETTLEGDAGELRTALAANDTAIAEWSNKSLGRRLSALWPHVAATFDAKRTEGRCGWKFRIAKRSNAGLRV